MQQAQVNVLAWVEATGIATAARLADAMGITPVEAAGRLLRLYRIKCLHREREASFRRPFGWHYRYWISKQGIAKLRWLRGW